MRAVSRSEAIAASAQRIFARSEVTDDGCVLWTGPVNSSGYAMVRIPGGESACAHRVTTEWASGPIPEGMTVDHVCHSRDVAACRDSGPCQHRRCVNPDHLEVVTIEENQRRGMRVQQTHCKRDHAFTPENTYLGTLGQRNCIACREVRRFEHYLRTEAPSGLSFAPRARRRAS